MIILKVRQIQTQIQKTMLKKVFHLQTITLKVVLHLQQINLKILQKKKEKKEYSNKTK